MEKRFDGKRVVGDVWEGAGYYRFREWVETDGDFAVDDWRFAEVPPVVWVEDEDGFRECTAVPEGSICVVEYLGDEALDCHEASRVVEDLCGDFADDFDLEKIRDGLFQEEKAGSGLLTRFFPVSVTDDELAKILDDAHFSTLDRVALKVADMLAGTIYELLPGDAFHAIAERVYEKHEDETRAYFSRCVTDDEFWSIVGEIADEYAGEDE